ncbi:hypothetical protein SFC66_09005 [Terribacillus saccharophilus]
MRAIVAMTAGGPEVLEYNYKFNRRRGNHFSWHTGIPAGRCG